MSKIYVFGNSHSPVFSQTAFTGNIGVRGVSPNGKFITRTLGDTIAYNFYEHHYPRLVSFLESETEFDKDKDYVLLVVGEVDCRLHLVNQIRLQSHRSEEEVIEECVDRFFRCHLDLKARGYKVIGWGSHPSTFYEAEHVIGPYHKRLWIACYFAKHLQRRCEENGILFKSIFESILIEGEYPDSSKYLDYCHLNPQCVSQIIEKEFADL